MPFDSGSVQDGAPAGQGPDAEKAATGVYAPYYAIIRDYIAKRVDCAQDAEDMAQEALLALCKRRPRDPQAYMFMVARNLVRRYWRNQRTKRQVGALFASRKGKTAATSEPDGLVSAEWLQRILAGGHVRLSAGLREAVMYRFVRGLSCEEAARRIGCSKGALRKRLQRARKALRKALTDDQ